MCSIAETKRHNSESVQRTTGHAKSSIRLTFLFQFDLPERIFQIHAANIEDVIYIHTYLAQTPEIGQGLVRFLSCGARKQEQT